MRTRAFAPIAVPLVALAACASPPPPPPQAPTAPPVEAPPPPTRAHWVFPLGRRVVKAQMPLEGGARLYVGVDGLRELAKPGAEPVDAQTVELDDLLGVLKDDKGQLLFVAVNGDAFPASDPLGVLGPARPGPLHGKAHRCGPTAPEACGRGGEDRFAWVTTGRAAILGVTRDGRLLRSPDYGASWHEVAYAGGGKPYGRPHAIELDPHGNGLLLHYPQRVFVTHDDGASWAPVASPGIGAHEIFRDGDDRLWLVGSHGRARLEGESLRVTSERPSPLVRAADEREISNRYDDGRKTLLCGDRLVELSAIEGDKPAVRVASAPFGEKPVKTVDEPKLFGTDGLSPLVACRGPDMVYLQRNHEAGGEALFSTVFRSHDWGATWTEEPKIPGVAPQESTDVDVTVGPEGWTYVTSLCPGASTDDNECEHRKIRPAKASAFEDMAFTEEFAPRAFAFDVEHDRVYAAGIRNGVTYLYESPLTQNHFTRVRQIDGTAYQHLVMTVDASGTLRTLVRDEGRGAWVLERRPFGGDPLPTLYVPLADGAMSFAGGRGLLFSERGDGWETADGGETWTATSRLSTTTLACSDAGCVDEDGAERVGWDLPALKSGDVVTAMPEPPSRADEPPRPAPAPAPTLDLVCKPSGSPSTIASIPGSDLVDSRGGEVRWATVKRDADGKLAVVYGTKSGVREAQLLGAAPKPPPKPLPGKPQTRVTSGDRVLNDGVVAVRYHLTTDPHGARQPIDIELAWWSSVTGKTHRHELKKVPPFYVPSYNAFYGTPQIVEGGLLFQPTGGREVYFARDDGKLETFTVPTGASVQTAERIGKSWLLLDPSGGNAGIFWSNEGATSWARRDWGLESTGRTSMALLDGKPFLAYAPSTQPAALFPLGGSPASDPPAPIVVRGGSAEGVCEPKGATLRDVAYVPIAQRHLRARVEIGKADALPAGRLTIGYRVTHVTGDGALCTSADVLAGNDPKTNDGQTAFLYPEAKGYSGWWFTRAPDPKDKTKKVVHAQPLTCEPGAPEPRR